MKLPNGDWINAKWVTSIRAKDACRYCDHPSIEHPPRVLILGMNISEEIKCSTIEEANRLRDKLVKILEDELSNRERSK